MLNRLRTALVSSFVGAIGLGWILAQTISHAVGIVVTPLASWISRREFAGMPGSQAISVKFYFQDAVPELLRTAFLAALGFALLRWLYFKPVERQTEPGPEPQSEGTV